MAIGAIVAAVAYFAYGLVDGHVIGGPTVYIRNETRGWVNLGIAGSGIDDEDQITVRQSTTGACATATWVWHHQGNPTATGNNTAAMWAEPGTTTTITYTPIMADRPLYIRVDADGVVHTGEALPADQPGCTPVTVKDGWEWSADDP